MKRTQTYTDTDAQGNPVQKQREHAAILPLTQRSTHLGGAVDFGTVVRGQQASQQFTLTNLAKQVLTVSLSAPAGMTVSTYKLLLQPAGAPGSAATVTATLTATVDGPYSSSLTTSILHSPFKTAVTESIPVTATVRAPLPAQLVVSVPEWGLQDVDQIDLGLIAGRFRAQADGSNAPSFALQITNVGELTATDVSLQPSGPGADYGGFWDRCNYASPEFCVSPAVPGDIPGQQSVTVTVRVASTGDSASFLETIFVRSDTVTVKTVEIVGEIVPYALPDGVAFLRPLGSGAGQLRVATQTAGFGEETDPLSTDGLDQLRVTSFDARTLFSVGEVDTVDLRAGNLTLVVPIGDAVPVRGVLSYQLQAVYNSDLWYRKTMGQFEIEVNGRYKARPLDAEWANPLYNLRGGWTMHLGRLLPPRNYQGTSVETLCQAGDPFDFEDQVDTSDRYVYVDPSGTQHEFWRHLHGDEYSSEGTVGQGDQTYYYTRDGSHLRLYVQNVNVRWVEEPGGIRHRFQRRGTGSPALTTSTLPDEWLLTKIEDPYGNRAQITYGATTWTIADNANWRPVTLTFKTYAGREADEPMIVDQVQLPGFQGGAARVYTFNYQDVTLDRDRGAFYANAKSHCEAQGYTLNTIFQIPRLDSITGPEGFAWSFTYASSWGTHDDLRMTKVGLPSGGSIDYAYGDVWDASSSCSGEGNSKLHPGVTERTVSDVGGDVIERTRYLRQYRRDDIPQGICAAHPPSTGSLERPLSKQVVAVWKDQQDDLSTLTKHYFNIWPYDDRCPSGLSGCVDIDPGNDPTEVDWRLASRRTFRDRNAPVDPSQKDAAGLMLSTQTYSCPWNIAGGPASIGYVARSAIVTYSGDNIDDVTGFDRGADGVDCQKKTSDWKAIEVELAGTCTDGNLWCNRSWRVASEKTEYHDDGDKWSRVDRSDYDGLGHYRRSVSGTSWDTTSRTKFTNFNTDAGTLLLDGNYRVTRDITLPSIWLLETYEDHWVNEGSVYRGGEAHFDATLGHLELDRTWRCASPGYQCNQAETSLSSTRTSTDLVVRYTVNAQGEVTREQHFGADTGLSVPTGNTWYSDGIWSTASPDYAISTSYSFGIPSRRYVEGDSVDEMDRVVDQNTGWTVSETLNSGEVKSFTYDELGRIRWITSGVTASRRFTYTAPTATSGWQLDATVYLKDVTAGSTPPAASQIRSYTARYDGLGRLVQETLPTYNSTVNRNLVYHPSGKVKSVTALDLTTAKWVFDYDYAGRQVLETRPDGSKRKLQHVGARRVWDYSCVDTGGTGSSLNLGICNGTNLAKADAKLDRDGHGRVASTTSPTGIVTSFTYDPAGNVLTADRTDGAITQTRSWIYDGLGFRLSESIPERAATSFSSFTTRGLARTVNDGSRERALVYDVLGRLRSHTVGGVAVKSFVYCDPGSVTDPLCSTTGSENGQLIRATRRNVRSAEYSGVFSQSVPQAGIWEVESEFGYDDAGRQDFRATKVRWDPDVGATTGWTEFDQSWDYDDVGNVTRRAYPTCVTPAGQQTAWECADDSFVVTNTYAKGFYLTDVAAAGTTTLGASLTYHPGGLVATVNHGGLGDTYGLAVDASNVVTGMPRIGSIQLGISFGFPTLDLGTLRYDGAGNIRSIGTETFQYDLDSRLTYAAIGALTRNYGYDNFDNITNGAGGTIDQTTNRLAVVDGNGLPNGYSYDEWGNLIAARIGTQDMSAVYDELDKLIAVVDDPATPTVTHQLSVYDHDDLRVLRAERPGGKTTWSLRDGLQVVRELEGVWDQIQTRKDYVYAGSRLISSRTYAGSYPTGDVSHYHADQVGSSRLITGSNANQAHYEPFGKPYDRDPGDQDLAGSGERTVGFQGHETDGAVTYMRGRSYLPSGGRFLQVDPARDSGAWSAYAFAINNPMKLIDRSGRAPEESAIPDAVVTQLSMALNGYSEGPLPRLGIDGQPRAEPKLVDGSTREAHENHQRFLADQREKELTKIFQETGLLEIDLDPQDGSTRQTVWGREAQKALKKISDGLFLPFQKDAFNRDLKSTAANSRGETLDPKASRRSEASARGANPPPPPPPRDRYRPHRVPPVRPRPMPPPRTPGNY